MLALGVVSTYIPSVCLSLVHAVHLSHELVVADAALSALFCSVSITATVTAPGDMAFSHKMFFPKHQHCNCDNCLSLFLRRKPSNCTRSASAMTS
jgi:hypothetical protein